MTLDIFYCNIFFFTQNGIVNANGHAISIFPLSNVYNIILIVDGVDMKCDLRSTLLIVIDDYASCIASHSCSNVIKVSLLMPLVAFA